jgi:hypothetical protein
MNSEQPELAVTSCLKTGTKISRLVKQRGEKGNWKHKDTAIKIKMRAEETEAGKKWRKKEWDYYG